MKRRHLTILVTAVAVWITGAIGPVRAQDAAPRSRVPASVTPTARSAAAITGGSSIAVITGHTLTAGRAPVPYSTVRLRNLSDGTIVGRTASDHVGEFSFTLPGGGMFIPEVLADASGEVLAVGDIITLEAGEAAGVVVLLPARVPSAAGLFGSAAAGAVDAAAGAGIAAVTAGDAVTPEE